MSHLVAFEMEDQFKNTYSHADFWGHILVVVGSDKEGASVAMEWGKALGKSLKPEIDGERVSLIGLSDLRGVPFFLKKYVRGKFSQSKEDWALLDWRHDSDPTPTNFPSGVTDVWHSLLYFKPIDLGDTGNPWQDPEVTRRSSDYRSPDTLVVVGGRGSRWADDREYAPVADSTDFYNEAEGAYVVNIDPTLGLEVDIDGSPTDPRYAPLFKIRQWRSAGSWA